MSLADTFAGRRVLVTGGLGFIGSNLAHRLVDLGARVLIVDSLIPDYGGNLYNAQDIRDVVKINIADVRDIHTMRYLVQGQDFLFNLAGQVSHIDSMTDPFTDLEIGRSFRLWKAVATITPRFGLSTLRLDNNMDAPCTCR
jgi:UDP-glucose 4-epimerase